MEVRPKVATEVYARVTTPLVPVVTVIGVVVIIVAIVVVVVVVKSTSGQAMFAIAVFVRAPSVCA